MPQLDGALLGYLVGILFAAGAAWATIFIKERNLDKHLDSLEKDFLISEGILNDKIESVADELSAHKEETADRLARIETKIDLLLLQHQPDKS